MRSKGPYLSLPPHREGGQRRRLVPNVGLAHLVQLRRLHQQRPQQHAADNEEAGRQPGRGGDKPHRDRRHCCGGAVGGGFYDRPNAPATGTIATSFSRRDFLTGLFPASAFPTPAPGQNGTLGRNTFRGPHFTSVDLSLARGITIREGIQLQFRFEAFNALNNVNLFLPNADLSLASFGKSTQAHDARTLQGSLRLTF